MKTLQPTKLSCAEFVERIKRGEIDVIEHTHKILEEAEKANHKYNYFTVISRELALEQAEKLKKESNVKGKLSGVPISVKDCICVKGVESTASSAILKGYIPINNATAVEKAVSEGAIIIGKTVQDEFGFGSFCTNPGLGFKIPKNPLDEERCTGGSSGGAAGFAKLSKHFHVAMAESTGGSIAAPSSYCGVYGLTPSYGAVSRYGLIDYSNSFDKIGSIGKSKEDAFALFDAIKGKDEKDSTSLDVKNKVKKVKSVGVVKELVDQSSEEVKRAFWNKIRELESDGMTYDEIKLPLTTEYSLQCYYIIAMSEASTNLARYCGMRYGAHENLQGNFNEYFKKVRSKHFGKEAKRRIILGTFARMAGYRDAYYMKAMKARTLIIQEYKNAFKKHDLIVHPSMPNVAPKFKDIKKLSPMENYLMDVMTAGCNLAGFPHLSVPMGEKSEMPSGFLAIANHFNEDKLRIL